MDTRESVMTTRVILKRTTTITEYAYVNLDVDDYNYVSPAKEWIRDHCCYDCSAFDDLPKAGEDPKQVSITPYSMEVA